MGDPRAEHVARNEATSREMNERLEESHDGNQAGDTVRMICECGTQECERVVAITIDEYSEVREDARHFVVVHEHVDPSIERVIRDAGRFVVVEKTDGAAAEVAEEEDPRS